MPNKRLPLAKRIDNEINALRYNLGEGVAPKDVFGKLVELAMRRIVQEVLENEVSEFTGRNIFPLSNVSRMILSLKSGIINLVIG